MIFKLFFTKNLKLFNAYNVPLVFQVKFEGQKSGRYFLRTLYKCDHADHDLQSLAVCDSTPSFIQQLTSQSNVIRIKASDSGKKLL